MLAHEDCAVSNAQIPGTAYTIHNQPRDFEIPTNLTDYVSLTAPPSSRITRREVSSNEITAPMVLKQLETNFVLAEVTVAADFEVEWDQAGLVIFASPNPFVHMNTSSLRQRMWRTAIEERSQYRDKWAKVGLELCAGELSVSTVVANSDSRADWSSTPAFPCLTAREAVSMPMPSLRVKLERVGCDLWAWYRIPDDLPTALMSRTPEVLSRSWKKCREVTGFFDDSVCKGGIWVGCYASRPMNFEDATDNDGLFVEFEDLEVL